MVGGSVSPLPAVPPTTIGFAGIQIVLLLVSGTNKKQKHINGKQSKGMGFQLATFSIEGKHRQRVYSQQHQLTFVVQWESSLQVTDTLLLLNVPVAAAATATAVGTTFSRSVFCRRRALFDNDASRNVAQIAVRSSISSTSCTTSIGASILVRRRRCCVGVVVVVITTTTILRLGRENQSGLIVNVPSAATQEAAALVVVRSGGTLVCT